MSAAADMILIEAPPATVDKMRELLQEQAAWAGRAEETGAPASWPSSTRPRPLGARRLTVARAVSIDV